MYIFKSHVFMHNNNTMKASIDSVIFSKDSAHLFDLIMITGYFCISSIKTIIHTFFEKHVKRCTFKTYLTRDTSTNFISF